MTAARDQKPQLGSQPQAGSAQPQAGASQPKQLLLLNSFDRKPGFLMPQPLSQAGASQPQAGASMPQAGSQGASTPQAGSAQPLSQPLLHNRPPNRPAEAFAEVKTAKAAASTREETTRRIVGTPKGLGTDLLLEPRRFPAKTNPQCQGRSGRRSWAALSVKPMAEVVG